MVGGRTLQVETWLRGDRTALQHWALVGFGPIAPLELTAGGVYGAAFPEEGGTRFAAAGPQLQAKLSLFDGVPNGWPGVAVASGVLVPLGTGGFAPHGWDPFAYVALTEALFSEERLLVHANVGVAVASKAATGAPTRLAWGVATQLRTIAGLYVLAELFSGDPYAEGRTAAMQAGLRYELSDQIQLDATVGVGVFGEPRLPVWGTVGVRLASSQLW